MGSQFALMSKPTDSMPSLHYRNPVHRASGEVSVSTAGSDCVPVEAATAQSRRGQSLWGDGYWDTVEGRDEKQRQEKEEEDAERRQQELKRLQEEEKQMEREAMLKVKVLNTLFNKNISMESVQLTIRRALERKRKERAGLVDGELKDEAAGGGALEAQIELIVNAELDREQPPSVTRYRETNNRDSRGRDGSGGQDEDNEDGEDGGDRFNQDDLSSLGSVEPRYATREQHRNSILQAAGIQVPKFRGVQPASPLKTESTDPILGSLQGSLSNIAASKVRDKLRNLSSFIHGHTTRKIASHWNMLESRFKASHNFSFGTAVDEHGLTHQVRVPCLFASSLFFVLCSNKVKVGFQELKAILSHLGITERGQMIGRQIAALNQTLQLCGDLRAELTQPFKDELQELMHHEKELISINDLIACIFPDEKTRDAQLTELRANRHNEVTLLMEDKRKRDELKAQQEKRRLKIVDDFEKILEQVQLFKSTLSKLRLDQFLALIAHCDKTVAESREDISAKLPADVVFFLGVEAFPVNLQTQLLAKQKRKGLGGFDTSSGPGQLTSQNSVMSMTSQTSSQVGVGGLAAFNNYFDNLDAPPDSVTRAKLRGPPLMMQSLREMVKLGKPFPGLSYREAVEIMQYIAVSKIAAAARGFCRRWRFNAARVKVSFFLSLTYCTIAAAVAFYRCCC
jgi:hypothetical protein